MTMTLTLFACPLMGRDQSLTDTRLSRAARTWSLLAAVTWSANPSGNCLKTATLRRYVVTEQRPHELYQKDASILHNYPIVGGKRDEIGSKSGFCVSEKRDFGT